MKKFNNQPWLYDKLIANRPMKNVRPKSVELVSLLKTGNMDYAWEYLSVAVQHDLKFIKLPDKITGSGGSCSRLKYTSWGRSPELSQC